MSLTSAQASTQTAALTPVRISSVLPPWQLVWSDEFSGTTLDRDAWNVENNSTYGNGNKELACLMDRPENVKVAYGLWPTGTLRSGPARKRPRSSAV